MTPGVADHALVAFLLVVVPVYGRRSYQRLLSQLETAPATARLVEYRETLVLQWCLTLALVAAWVWQRRPLAELGLVVPLDGRSLVGCAVTLGVLGFLAFQWRAIKALDATGLEPVRVQLAGAQALLPTTDEEHRWFRAVSVTAGICEETLYRGFLVWYATHVTGPWTAAVLAAVMFGAAHIYQGHASAIKAGVAGLLAGLLYVGTSSVLWPAILHAAADLQGGAAGRLVGPSDLRTPGPQKVPPR